MTSGDERETEVLQGLGSAIEAGGPQQVGHSGDPAGEPAVTAAEHAAGSDDAVASDEVVSSAAVPGVVVSGEAAAPDDVASAAQPSQPAGERVDGDESGDAEPTDEAPVDEAAESADADADADAEPAAPIDAAPEPESEPAPELNPAPVAPPARQEPLTREEAVTLAVRGWRESLSALGGESALRDIDALADATLDLSAAHPGGMAQLLAGRLTPLGLLVREPSALAHARRRARAVMAQAAEHSSRYGVSATTAALGVITWGPSADGSRPALLRAPVFLRQIDLVEGEHEPSLRLHGRAQMNPVVEHALLRAGVTPQQLVEPELEGSSDLREALDAVRQEAAAVLSDLEVTELIVVGSFAHPGQLVADDLAGDWLVDHDVVAALAGDPGARAALDVPLPPVLLADRDPGTERGVGDLDIAQQHVLDVVASGIDVVVDAPPGTATTETVAAIVADAAASGRTVVHVPGTRRAGESLVARLIELGLDGMVLDAAGGASQGRDVGGLVTARLGADLPEIDAPGIMRMRGDLSRLRSALSARVRAWHAVHPDWGVSPHGAMQALAEITLRRPAPRGTVRLSVATVNRLTGRGLDEARGELATAATLGTFQLRRSDSPWYGVALVDSEQARGTVDAVHRLAARTLPALRQRIAVATAQTGLEPARTLAVWVEQLRMLQGVRAALDVFQPEIFERSAADLVAATAPRADRGDHEGMAAANRRRLRKQARDLLRPGRHVDDLHAELAAAAEQREIWRVHCPAGGWPRLPEEMTELIDATHEVQAAVADLDGPLRPTLGDGTVPLDHIDLDRLADHLLSLAEDESISRALPERTEALSRLTAVGLGELVEDLAARRVPVELVTSELDLAWWSSVLAHIIGTEPALRGATSFAQDVELLRSLDTAQVESLVPPVALATASYLRTLAVADKERARDLFRAADAARRGSGRLDLRELRSGFGLVGRTVVPCWSVPPMLVPQVLPRTESGARDVDVVVLDSVQNLTIEQVVAAIGRAHQVVVVGDVRRGGDGVVARLADVLPVVQLDGARTDRDESLSAFLAENGYDGAVVGIPSPPGPSAIRLDIVEGRALAAHGGVVETVPDEVDHIVDLVIDHALTRPEESLAVIALNTRHAARIREAVAQATLSARAVADALDPGRLEPFAVVDVEQAAGMRRDAVILAVGYGKTPHGRVIHQFGAISSPQGVSLLVDAVEACRSRLVVTSCLAPSDLDSQRLRSAGSRMLADLLQFAATGGVVATTGREGDPDPLLVDLADRLWRMGLEVLADYGPPGGVRIPLVVGHPSLPGKYGVAVLTDTDGYVATPSLRMRDRYWVERLEQRGWSVVVLSSLDVFLDPEAAARRVLDAVSQRVRALPRPAATPVVAPAIIDDDDAADEQLLPVAGAVGTVEQPELPLIPERTGERPDVFAGLPMGAYSLRELEALGEWVQTDGIERTPPELVAVLRSELALPLSAPRVDEVLGEVAARVLEPRVEVGADGGAADGDGNAEELAPVPVTAAEIVAAEGKDVEGVSDTREGVTDEVEDSEGVGDSPEGVTDEAADVAAPAEPADPVEPAAPEAAPVIPDRAWEDDDRGWGDSRGGDDDDRILRERPPHW